ncbi:Uu.00g042360.m01.CDS01 [Anthostomella pinea]|uniref:Uu.00g042360.m01.CDS01 n=1 Tax=Anthostomella pinea TaxID=933095 RepID=A0AAI8V5K6_9PEZI|nr:Uu.00g042360.m01.CDS01 [Anthostomella pinea]
MADTNPKDQRTSSDREATLYIDASNSAAVQALSHSDPKFDLITIEAKAATQAEHAMPLRQAIKLYPKAILWSIFFSTAIAMEGYDLVLVQSFFAFPAFAEKYGVLDSKGKYGIPAPWQAGLSNGARVGEILGLFVNGIVCDKFGFRKTMVGTLVLLCGLIFIPFFAQNIETIQVGQILLGIPWGVFQTLTTAYAAEVCPVALRGYLTTYVNMMWGLGQLLASGVLRAMLKRTDQWAYRIPFALQWMWPVPLIVGIALAPESPWWLVRKGRHGEAKTSLRRLSQSSNTELDHTLSMMRYTNEIEKEVSAGTSYIDCFRGVHLRRTEITCFTWVIQAASGASFMGYAAYFFEQAGLPTSISFDFSISLYAVAMIGVAISWFAMTYLGRRTIYLSGLSAMFVVLITIGFVNISPSKGTSYATGSLLLLFTLCYDITIGTVAYSIVAEMPSSRLRTKTIVLARNLYNVQGITNGVITPYMLNPDAWNWKGKAGFFWAGLALLCLIWTFFRLPEPKGRTYAELDLLFEQKVSARKFRDAVVDTFESPHHTTEVEMTTKDAIKNG